MLHAQATKPVLGVFRAPLAAALYRLTDRDPAWLARLVEKRRAFSGLALELLNATAKHLGASETISDLQGAIRDDDGSGLADLIDDLLIDDFACAIGEARFDALVEKVEAPHVAKKIVDVGNRLGNRSVRIADAMNELGLLQAVHAPDGPSQATTEEWPDPLAPEAFQGLPGKIVRLVEPHTEADRAALLVQLLVTYGNVVGRASHFLVEADRHTMNLFAVLVGATAKGRKGTSWGHIRNLFESTAPSWAESRIAPGGLSSGEGLIWEVRDPILDKDGEVRDPGISDKRLLVVEGEYASVLRVMGREGNTLSAVLRNAWDRGALRSITKNSPARATGAHVSIIGHITIDELRRYLDRTEAGNGFGNRHLWVCVRRSKLLPEGGGISDVDFTTAVNGLRAAIDFGLHTTRVTFDAAAREAWRAVYPDLSEGAPGLFGAITSRAEAQVVRLAAIYALMDQSPSITRDHLLAGLAVWEYAEASARFIFGASLGDPVADEILKALKTSPDGLSRTEISRGVFAGNRKAAEIQRALEALARQGLARREPRKDDKGRPAETWIATLN